MNRTGDYTGFSTISMEDAIQDALAKAGDHSRYELIEALGAQDKAQQKEYKVTLKTFID